MLKDLRSAFGNSPKIQRLADLKSKWNNLKDLLAEVTFCSLSYSTLLSINVKKTVVYLQLITAK